MKKLLCWKRILTGTLVTATCLVSGAVGVGAADASAPVSYGLGVLASEFDMAVSGRVGNEILFDERDFARNLNLSCVDYITVSTLPKDTEGELLLGSTRVVAGQTISGGNLSHLCFAAASDDIRHASFTFTANGSATPMVCNLYLLEESNSTPTLAMAPELSLRVSTYRELPAFGTLSAYDPDGDEMVFEIVSYPQNGALRMTDRHEGTYVYTPKEGYVGTDSFSYVARDKYGNYSAMKTVDLRVSVSGTSVNYADMNGSDAHNAALMLCEAGIMSGTQVGQQYYFHPTATVNRAEFLVMAMHAAGVTDVPACDQTVFFDDRDIPESMKGYAAAAQALGYISGTNIEGNLCFLPGEEITRAEAAVMLEAIIGMEAEAPGVIPTFADGSEIPVWAKESIYLLHAAGILTPADGNISATESLTRADCAKILAAVMAYQNG